MTVDCRYCHQSIADECLSPNSTAVGCPSCNIVADYPQLGASYDEAADTGIEQRSSATLPKGWLQEDVAAAATQPGSVYRSMAIAKPTLLLSRRWPIPQKLSILWSAVFVLTGLAAAFARFDLWQPAALCVLLILPIWGVLAINRTTLRLDGEWLRIRHTPMPLIGHRDILKSRLKQLFCQQYNAPDGETTYYAVCALLPNGQQRLVGGFEKAEDALHIKQLLASAWHLDVLTVAEYSEVVAEQRR